MRSSTVETSRKSWPHPDFWRVQNSLSLIPDAGHPAVTGKSQMTSVGLGVVLHVTEAESSFRVATCNMMHARTVSAHVSNGFDPIRARRLSEKIRIRVEGNR
jgi:hypothetical protein